MNWEKIIECGFQRRINKNYWKHRKAVIVTPIYGHDNEKLRTSKKYWHWRRAVLWRDNFTCRNCPSKINLEVHHIRAWSIEKKQRFMVENGITLCRKCHTKKHNWLKDK